MEKCKAIGSFSLYIEKPSALLKVLQALFTSFYYFSSPRDLFNLKRSNLISIIKMTLAYMLTEWKTWPILSQSQSK
jgi:hypothetical protein